MKRMTISKMTMINNKAVAMKMRMRTVRVIKTNSKARAMTMINNNNQNSSNNKRRTKNYPLSNWLIDNSLNSLSSLLYWAKYPIYLARWITLLALCIQVPSRVCPEGLIRIIMASRKSFTSLDWRISKYPNPKYNQGLLSWKTMTPRLIWNLKLSSSRQNLSNKNLLSKLSLIKYQHKVKNSFHNFINRTKNLKDGKSTLLTLWILIWLHSPILTVLQTQVKVFTTVKISSKESSMKKGFSM